MTMFARMPSTDSAVPMMPQMQPALTWPRPPYRLGPVRLPALSSGHYPGIDASSSVKH